MDRRKFNKGTKGNKGGRKPKSDELALIERLSVYDDKAQEKLFELIDEADYRAIQLFYAYRYGKPKETVSMTVQQETPILDVE